MDLDLADIRIMGRRDLVTRIIDRLRDQFDVAWDGQLPPQQRGAGVRAYLKAGLPAAATTNGAPVGAGTLAAGARTCAGIRDADTGRPLGRDDYARFLGRRAAGLREGSRVQVTDQDGRTVTGTWETRPEYEDAPAVVIRRDNGTTYIPAVDADLRVLDADRDRRALLTDGEAEAVAGLLDELAAVYDGDALGRQARTLAALLYDRLGV